MKITPLNFDVADWEYPKDIFVDGLFEFNRDIKASQFRYKSNEESVYKLVLRWEFTAKNKNATELILQYNGEHFYIIQMEEDRANDQKQMERIVSQAYLKYCSEFDSRKYNTILRNYQLDDINIQSIAKAALDLFQ